MGEGETEPLQRKKSYFGALKRLPGRLRGSSSSKSTALGKPESNATAAHALPPLPKLNALSSAEEDMEDMDTHTVAPSARKQEVSKLVVPSNSSSTASAKGKGDSIPEDEAPRLVYFTSYGSKVTYPLVWEECTIGRKDENQIVLTDSTISKCHASVYRKPDGYIGLTSVYIIDRKSSNGVRINDIFISPNVPMLIRTGDVIMVGSIKLIFYASPKDANPNADKEPKGTAADNLKLVTILPAANNYDDHIAIKAEIETEGDILTDFKPLALVDDINTLKEDYEKLRLAYELSKITLTNDINLHLEKSLDLIFEILPVDRGVVLLVDQYTGTLATQHVKLRHDLEDRDEIILSSTILKRVYETRKCLVTMDASKDTTLQAAASVMHSHIRSVICIPLIAHQKVHFLTQVHGIIHLDSQDAIPALSSKDLSVIKAISNQTAIAIENSVLMVEQEANAKINEQLSRFLAPHVVSKMTDRSDIIKKGGRQIVGTIIFCDIRGFTNLSERSTPVEVVNLLNDYFERVHSLT